MRLDDKSIMYLVVEKEEIDQLRKLAEGLPVEIEAAPNSPLTDLVLAFDPAEEYDFTVYLDLFNFREKGKGQELLERAIKPASESVEIKQWSAAGGAGILVKYKDNEKETAALLRFWNGVI